MSFDQNFKISSPATANLNLIAEDVKVIYQRLAKNKESKEKTSKAFKIAKTTQKRKVKSKRAKLNEAQIKTQNFENQAISNEVHAKESSPLNTTLFQLGSEANVNQLEQYRELSALLPTNEQVKLPSTQSKINLAELIHTQEQKQIQQENKVFSRRLSSNLFNYQYQDPVSLRLHLKNQERQGQSYSTLVGISQSPNNYSQSTVSNLLLLVNPVSLAFSFVLFKKLMEKLLETTRHRLHRPLRIFRIVKKRLVKRAMKKVERLRGGFNELWDDAFPKDSAPVANEALPENHSGNEVVPKNDLPAASNDPYGPSWIEKHPSLSILIILFILLIVLLLIVLLIVKSIRYYSRLIGSL